MSPVTVDAALQVEDGGVERPLSTSDLHVLATGAATAAKQDTEVTALASLLAELGQKVEPADLAALATSAKQDTSKAVLDAIDAHQAQILAELGQKLEPADLAVIATETTLAAAKGDLDTLVAKDFATNAKLEAVRALLAGGIGVTVGNFPATYDVADRAARLLGHVSVDNFPATYDVLDRAARLLGHVAVDSLPGNPAQTADVQAVRDRLPAALVGGRLDVTLGASGITLGVDTELSAAAAISTLDTAGDPSLPGVAAYNMAWDATLGGFRRVTIDSNRLLFTRIGFVSTQVASSGADGQTVAHLTDVPMLFNGTNLDRARSNQASTLLASAGRTGTTSSADQTNANGRGVQIVVDATALGAASTLTVTIEGKDPASGKYYTLLAGAAINATGTFVYEVAPGASSAAAAGITARTAGQVPRTWRVTVTHSNANSCTYSIGANLLL